MKKIFKNRNFFLLFQGTLVSAIGNSLYNFAIGWYILDLTGSPVQMGTYMATGAIIMLILTPFSGVIADRFDKVKIVYLTDFVRGIAILAAGYAIFQDLSLNQSMIVLYSATIVLAINGALFNPASGSLMPELVEQNEYQTAGSAMSMINSIQGIVGILLGGVLYSLLGVGWIFIINAATFIFSGISEMFIRNPHTDRGKLDITSGLRDMKEGFMYLVGKRGLMHMMVGFAILNFAFIPIMANGFPYLFNVVLEVDAFDYSMVQVAWSIGTLIGAIAIGSIATRLKIFKSTFIGLLAMMAGFLGISFFINQIITGSMTYQAFFWSIAVLMASIGIMNMYLNIPLNAGFMRAIEPEYRGRAFSVVGTMSQAAVPLAMFLGGILIELQGIMFVAYSSIIILLLILVYLFTNRNVLGFIRSLDQV